MNFAIVGCGLIGQKRAKALKAGGHSIHAAIDSKPELSERLSAQYPGSWHATDWRLAASSPEVDCVVVATTNQWLAPITLAAAQAGKHVIVEKPAARTVKEIEPVIAAAEKAGVQVQVGFNHRYHPALQKAQSILASGVLGPLYFIRGRYGHGARVGYDKEWRANPEMSGGGELIDQGVHVIDLSRWFLGDFVQTSGHAATYFWNMPVDDNAFLSLRTETGQTAWLQVSCTEWRNLFSMEIYGRNGKLDIQGLGGSYGVERLAYYRMLPEMGPPETTIWEYPGEDKSWQLELADFERSIQSGTACGPTLLDAKAALQIVECVYKGIV